VQVVSLAIEEDGLLVLGLSQRVKDFPTEVEGRFLDSTGHLVKEVTMRPYQSTRNIASAWTIEIPDHEGPLSLSLK